MDSWSYDCEGKGLLFTGFEAVEEAMEFMDFGFSDMKNKPFLGNTNLGISGEEQFGTSKHSSPLIYSDSPESSLIDYSDSKGCKLLKETPTDSSILPVSMSKKAPTTSSDSHAHHCQVYGCNKDLSSSKDYYKRNKVCETHSKTAKVIVNGTEMRFCQQCSRFHLLVEFDDGKRSCRKRLVGHNERRRKFHFGMLSRKSKKFLQSYQGTKFMRSSMSKKTSFLISNAAFEGYSNCAPYLLSTQSHDSSTKHVTEIQINKPIINRACHPLCSSEKANGSAIVDLLQLSAYLQRVEQQRSSIPRTNVRIRTVIKK